MWERETGLSTDETYSRKQNLAVLSAIQTRKISSMVNSKGDVGEIQK
jgi:hypothetical protein